MEILKAVLAVPAAAFLTVVSLVVVFGPFLFTGLFITNIVLIIGEKIKGNKIEKWLKVTTILYPALAGITLWIDCILGKAV